jgi:hypothetical protein
MILYYKYMIRNYCTYVVTTVTAEWGLSGEASVGRRLQGHPASTPH